MEISGGAQAIGLLQFSLIYLLLLIVIFILKKSGIKKSKILLWASVKMTIQLMLVGYLLTYIFENPEPIWTIGFILIMLIFSIHRIVNTEQHLNIKFKVYAGIALSFSGLFILIYFVVIVINENFFNPQYTIPLAGMIIGNAMTGITLGIKSFTASIAAQRSRIQTLQNLGATPKVILRPFINESLTTALLPTINSMLGMGIIFLPGMMTGQILSGTLPTTAIMYQIAIMIAVCTAVCISVYFTLIFGAQTFFNSKMQFLQND